MFAPALLVPIRQGLVVSGPSLGSLFLRKPGREITNRALHGLRGLGSGRRGDLAILPSQSRTFLGEMQKTTGCTSHTFCVSERKILKHSRANAEGIVK